MQVPEMNTRPASRRFLALTVAFGLVALLPASAAATPAGPPEPTYANGTVVYMNGPLNAHVTNAANHAYPLYLVVYGDAAPQGCVSGAILNPDACTPVPANNGYGLQCNPCHHFGVVTPADYHDHIQAGAPGFGTNGTAGSYNPAWHTFIVIYSKAFWSSPGFRQFLDDASLISATLNPADAWMFLPASTLMGSNLPAAATPVDASDPFVWDTGFYFLCNTTSAHSK
jgi:hypothetical protein